MFLVDNVQTGKRQKMLHRRLEREYTEGMLESVLLPLVTQTSLVALRALDWAVVNWSKKYNVICSSSIPGQMTNIHNSYRTTLSFWKRRLFDPFRRRSRIKVRIGGKEYETTLGQANFALWTYKTGVLSYVLNHIESIESHMNSVSKEQRGKRDSKGRRRTQLTRPGGTVCVACRTPSIVHFE